MNLDIIEFIEFDIKIYRRNTDNIINKFVDLVVNGHTKGYFYLYELFFNNKLLINYFKIPSFNGGWIYTIKNYYNSKKELVIYSYYWTYDINRKVIVFDYFKDDFKDLNYYIKNNPDFVKLLILCKKNEWLISSITKGIIKIHDILIESNSELVDFEFLKFMVEDYSYPPPKKKII